jgi:tetratricopeptide (TPR) repeat protein
VISLGLYSKAGLFTANKACGRSVFLSWLLLSLVLTSMAQSTNSAQVQQHLQQAQAALKANQPEVAGRELQAVLLLDPNNIEARTNLGVLSFFRGDCQVASQHFQAALKLQPSLTKAEALLGICEKRMGKSSAAARLEGSFSRLEDPKLRTQVGVELAGLYYQQGDISRSAAVMQKLIDLNPENVDILYMAQRTYAELADDTLNKLAILAPRSARMEQVIAERLVNAGDLPGAIVHYKKTLELDPHLPGVHYELAETIVEASPSDARAQSEAEREIEAAIRTDGDSSKIECLLGRIAFQRSDLAQTYAHYLKAFALDSRDPEAQLGLARVLMAMRKPQEARTYLEMAVQSDPLNGEAHYRLAVTFRNLQLNDEAQKEMRLFQEIKATKDQLKELYRQMNKPSRPHDDHLEDIPKATDKGQP